jgi:hypothetical protein
MMLISHYGIAIVLPLSSNIDLVRTELKAILSILNRMPCRHTTQAPTEYESLYARCWDNSADGSVDKQKCMILTTHKQQAKFVEKQDLVTNSHMLTPCDLSQFHLAYSSCAVETIKARHTLISHRSNLHPTSPVSSAPCVPATIETTTTLTVPGHHGFLRAHRSSALGLSILLNFSTFPLK